jgi:hypothetical protein
VTRFFAFGCSFTKYKWPTWADIIGAEFKQYLNYGEAGGGNHYIFNSFIECFKLHKINKDDVVGICWSNVLREDRYVKRGWILVGNIYDQVVYDKNFVDKFVCVRGSYIRDLAFISAVREILESIGCKYFFLSMVDMINPDQYRLMNSDDIFNEIYRLHYDTLGIIKPSFHRVIFNYDWDSRKELLKDNSNSRYDWHPLPHEHLEYVERVIPEITISNKTKALVAQATDAVKLTASKGLEFLDTDKIGFGRLRSVYEIDAWRKLWQTSRPGRL